MEGISPQFIFSAFIAGMVMFLAPCTLPLVPVFLGFIGGVSIESGKNAPNRFRTVVNTLFFVFGFSLVFILLGLSASVIGATLRTYQPFLIRIAGLLIIFFGLSLLGIVKIRFFDENRKSLFSRVVKNPGRFQSLFMGLAFGAGWTPCAGAITGAILTIAATHGKVFEGAFLLFIFSLGLAIPFLLAAFFYSQVITFIRRFTRVFLWVYRFSGAMLIFLGVLLITNNFNLIIRWGFRAFDFLEYQDFVIRLL